MNSTAFEPALMKIEPACRYLDVGRSKLYELIREGKLDAVKIGSTHNYCESQTFCREFAAERRGVTDQAQDRLPGRAGTRRRTNSNQVPMIKIEKSLCECQSSRWSGCSRRQGQHREIQREEIGTMLRWR